MKLTDLDRVIEAMELIAGSGFPDHEVNAWCAWCEGRYPHHYDECPDPIASDALTLLRKMRENATTLRFMGFVDGPTFDKMRADLEDNRDMTVSYGLGFRWESWGWDYEPQLAPCYVGERIGRHSTEDQRPLYDGAFLITPEAP